MKDPKGIFPYKLYDINYNSKLVPDFKYFSNITIDEYNAYKDSFIDKIWNFKDEAIKYCILDCISLHQILSKFNTLIFNKFKLNINKYPTLPSLSFNLFRTHYLKEDTIYMISGKIGEDIRKGYTGGAVDMYIPYSNKKIYAYDVNSLYPYVMANFKYPIGNPTYFEGDITKIEPNAFGFFYCKIIAPEGLIHPILQIHHKGNDGQLRTIAPLGEWEGIYFSEELYNAKKYGYKFEILWGYIFDKDYVFKDFVDNIYKLRLNYPKNDPMNLTAKLLMNAAYGRFGMDDNFTNTNILDKKDYLNLENNKDNTILDIINFV